ncbi:MAG: hypothetical protein LYZ69_03870 [Nitrososphaerales archaeon]|nr:hypothetical protein [Nitrososphaerales archaeon]
MKGSSRWSYYVAVDEIYHAKWAAKQLAKFELVREAIRHFWPEPDGYPVKLIQVAGTSGKGSTCQFLQSGLSAYGKAGCYVKPHVFDYAERFVLGNKLVGHDEIVRTWDEEVRPYCIESAKRGEAWLLDYFEVSLLLALKVFEKHKLDWGVVETGLGGRYDPVTALDVEATVVTNVGQDHENVLGEEHWQRALEKAGICRPGVAMFSGDRDARSTAVMSGICKDVGAPFYSLAAREVEAIRKDVGRLPVQGESDLLLGSQYQLVNAALAAKVIKYLVPSARLDRLARSFLAARYVGRFWKVEKDVFADVAHNPSKTRALSDDLKVRFPNARMVLVVGITGTRDPVAVIAPLVRHAKAIIVTAAGFKGQDPEKVYSRLRDAYPEVPIHPAPNPATTLSVAKNLRASGEKILYTGSTYMIDQALNSDENLRHLNGSVGWRDVKQKQIAGTVNFAIPEKS